MKVTYEIKKIIGKFIISIFNFFVLFYEGNKIFHSEKEYPDLTILKENYIDIVKEYKTVRDKGIIPGIEQYFEEQKVLSSNKSWKSFPFFIYGNQLIDNSIKCPKTVETLLRIEGMSTAMFSTLSANKEIKPHKGIYKGVVRVLLGIDVPENCFLKIKGLKKEWKNGEIMIFDDVFEHSAYNLSNKDRTVLFIDVIKKLPFPLSLFNKVIFTLLVNTDFIKNPIQNYKEFGNHSSKKIKLKFY